MKFADKVDYWYYNERVLHVLIFILLPHTTHDYSKQQNMNEK